MVQEILRETNNYFWVSMFKPYLVTLRSNTNAGVELNDVLYSINV